MATIRFFHEIYGNVHELPDKGSFPYERGLQEFFEKHLRTLTGVEFLASEYSTGQRHGRRIDTLGIDSAGRPVVIEYKRRRDENVINQGLDYLAWLEDHRAEFRELVREKLGDGRVTGIDFGTPRLLCIAVEFPRQDRIAAESSRRRIELLRYRRYGDAFLALEWLFGGEPVEPMRPPVAPDPTRSLVDAGDEPDYSIYEPWAKTSEATRTLFREFKTLVESFGSVRTVAFKTVMTFKYMVGRPQFSWTRIKGESDVAGGRGYGWVEACEGSWVGADGGSPEGDRSRRRRGGGGVGGLGAGPAVEREPETGRGVAAAAWRAARRGVA